MSMKLERKEKVQKEKPKKEKVKKVRIKKEKAPKAAKTPKVKKQGQKPKRKFYIGISAKIIFVHGIPFLSLITSRSLKLGNVSGLSKYFSIPGLCPAPTTAMT